MKKFCTYILCALLFCALPLSLCHCGADESVDDGKISIVTTIFPEECWVRAITFGLEDKADVTLLLDNGVDLHSYQPTAADLIMISQCDLFIYVGGESDAWADKALAQSDGGNALSMLEALGEDALREELSPGMEAEEKEQGESDEEEEYDEHIWLSLRRAEKLCGAITERLCAVLPDDADTLRSNSESYINELRALDARYSETISSSSGRALIFGDRFPFRYMEEDYGLTCYAAFAGCSAESEASFETVAFLSSKCDEAGSSYIIKLEESDGKLARRIAESTESGEKTILSLDSMQSRTSADYEAGITYLTIMKSNLEVLSEALG